MKAISTQKVGLQVALLVSALICALFVTTPPASADDVPPTVDPVANPDSFVLARGTSEVLLDVLANDTPTGAVSLRSNGYPPSDSGVQLYFHPGDNNSIYAAVAADATPGTHVLNYDNFDKTSGVFSNISTFTLEVANNVVVVPDPDPEPVVFTPTTRPDAIRILNGDTRSLNVVRNDGRQENGSPAQICRVTNPPVAVSTSIRDNGRNDSIEFRASYLRAGSTTVTVKYLRCDSNKWETIKVTIVKLKKLVVKRYRSSAGKTYYKVTNPNRYSWSADFTWGPHQNIDGRLLIKGGKTRVFKSKPAKSWRAYVYIPAGDGYIPNASGKLK